MRRLRLVIAVIATLITCVTTAHALVVGNGTPGSCTEAAFDAAFAAGGTVTFNCGGVVTITFTTPKTATGVVVVDGDHEVTLSGGNSVRPIAVAAGGDLTLQNLTLQN